MQTVRVVLAGMPPLLRDIVHASLGAEPGIRIVAELTEDYDALVDVPADVVIFSAGRGVADEILRPVLGRRDRTRLVVIAQDGASAYVCSPRGELSPATLCAAVRGG